MTRQPRLNEETRVRCFLAIGILLSLAAYLLFLWMGTGWQLVWPVLTALASLASSFYGFWSWTLHERDELSESNISENAGR
jgi:nicotinamide riboside transporter PnuC